MMKALHKKILTGTLAAGVLIGGGLVLQYNQVFANETSAATPAPTSVIHKDKIHKGFEKFHGGFEFGKGGMDLAAILGIDQAALKEEIKQGKTPAQIAQEKAGLTEEALLQKLTAAHTKKIDEALSAGKITQEQADKHKAGLAERLKKMIEAKPKVGDFHGKPQHRSGTLGHGARGNHEAIANILGITEEELATQQKAGKSLAEIAQEKGITEDQLIAKLKDSMADELKQFVQRKGGSHLGGAKLRAKADSSQAAATPAPIATP
ncbi:hypothetical protein [Paenibacillus sedimenti]|uniref:DUF2680 domain-containing protein n=1 Tax=Paenibacillus sedimenti TaxID=2770274 RepID=A0A926QLM4_9BACL|nr:hypothetical protein [Paenibacillus sedimenti]MBD0383785.1 hypothetical protein [Paenibacillus sedimenti]